MSDPAVGRSISPNQFALIMLAGFMPVGLFIFPRLLVVTAGSDALYAYAVECAWVFFGLWLWFRVNRLDPEARIPAAASRYVTPVLGYPVRALAVALHVLLGVLVAADFGAVMITFFLPNTPAWVIRLSVILVGVYMAWFDTPVLGRSIQVVIIPALILSLVMAVLLVTRMETAYAVLPATQIEPGKILLAAFRQFFTFWGYDSAAALYPYVRPAHRKAAERAAFRALAFAVLFFLVGYVLTMGVAGPAMIKLSNWPPISTMRLINVSAFVINKIGLLVVVLWGVFVMAFMAVRFWCVAHDVMPVVGFKSITHLRALILAAAAATFVLSGLFPNILSLEAWAQAYFNPTQFLYNFGVPPLLLLGAFVTVALRRRKAAEPA